MRTVECSPANVAGFAALLVSLAVPSSGFAQQPLCIPGTRLCAGANGNGGLQAGGNVQGRVNPNGATVNANGSANASGNANATAIGSANANGRAQGSGSGTATSTVQESGSANGNTNVDTGGTFERSYTQSRSEPIRFGAGLLLCATLKAGIYAGVKAGPCFAVSFRTERLAFEMESQLLIGGVRHSYDWVFPMSFVIPLTQQRSLYEGLQLRVGGSPIGVTFARSRDGGAYVRFGLHAGLSYEWGVSNALTWRVFDARAYLDFGTRREVDLHDNFLDFGGQMATGIVF